MSDFDPKMHIEEIHNRRIHSNEDVLDSLAGAIDMLQKAFPRRGHFLMEFIQNADDAQSHSLKVEISENVIGVLNDGRPFCKRDVESICKVGRSSKTPEDYIGYLGFGFKSVFLMSNSPQIYSGDYGFKFDRNHWPDPQNIPWQIIPIWISEDNTKSHEKAQYKTIFILPISTENEELIMKIEEETTPEHLSDRILLFLRNIERIEIDNQNIQLESKILKSENISPSKAYEIYLLREYENDVLKKEDKWLVFRSKCDVPKDVKEDLITEEWKRESVTKREVLAAFKLDGEDNLLEEERGTAHIGVFSYLPLKEDTPSGIKFLIQADFLTSPGRGSIPRDRILWNEWLAKEIFSLIIETCIPTFLEHKKWRMDVTKILYPIEWGHPLFDEHIKTPLKDYLDNEPVLIAKDGSTVKATEAISLESEVQKLLNESDFEMLYQGKKVLHPDCKVPWDIEKSMESGPSFNASNGLSTKMQELINLKAEHSDIDFFRQFYKELSDYAESTLRNSPLRHQNIILTIENNLTDSTRVYIKSENLSISPEVVSNFKLVHSSLTTDVSTLEFLKKLGVIELSREHIQNVLKVKEIAEISKIWGALSDREKIEKIRLCKELWREHQIEIKDLSFLTLKTRGGNWFAPNESVFPKEYKPDHKIEDLLEKDLLDLQFDFLSTEFIKDENDIEIRTWYEFLKELGVEQKLDTGHIAQRVGIKTALLFERESGRGEIERRELGESEKLGYDIVSKSSSEERHIEVKGSSEFSPRIPLTKREFETLQKEKDKYYVYVVEDALRDPHLYSIKGSELLGIPFSFISIDHKQWKAVTEEDFQT